jgi:hypothetical protein
MFYAHIGAAAVAVPLKLAKESSWKNPAAMACD